MLKICAICIKIRKPIVFHNTYFPYLLFCRNMECRIGKILKQRFMFDFNQINWYNYIKWNKTDEVELKNDCLKMYKKSIGNTLWSTAGCWENIAVVCIGFGKKLWHCGDLLLVFYIKLNLDICFMKLLIETIFFNCEFKK